MSETAHAGSPVEVDAQRAQAAGERRRRLEELGLLDPGQLPELQRLARIASRILRVPVSLVSFVSDDEQVFKGRAGELPERFRERTPLSHSFCRHVVESGQPLVVEDARTHPLVAENGAVSDLNVIAYMGSPVFDPDGDILGSLCAIDSQPRDWSDDELETLHSLAEIASTEIALRAASRRAHRARREAEATLVRERNLSSQLQRALGPQLELSVAGVRIGSLYRPASGLLGGDFLDTFMIGSDRIGLVVGDIVGKGLGAAARALDVRGELRRLAIRDASPAAVLAGLNALASRREGLFGTSLVYAIADLRGETLTWITAGHDPPLVRAADGETRAYVEASGGMLLGMHPPERPWTQRERRFALGSTVLLYTDGLVEVPGLDVSVREERLRAYVATGPEDPQELCDEIFSELPDPGAHDDVAVLALRHDGELSERLRD